MNLESRSSRTFMGHRLTAEFNCKHLRDMMILQLIFKSVYVALKMVLKYINKIYQKTALFDFCLNRFYTDNILLDIYGYLSLRKIFQRRR